MKQRVATAAVLIPLALVIVGSTSPVPVSIAAMAMAAIGVYELAGMFKVGQVLPVLTLLSLALPFYSVFIARNHQLAEFLLISASLFLLSVATLAVYAKRGNFSSSVVDIGGLWVSMPMLGLIALHQIHLGPAASAPAWNFASPALFALIPVWAGDTAALFVGKAIGRHPLASVSPGKTVEGAVANLIAAVGAAWALAHVIPIPLPVAVACGFCAGILGQGGDLFQSYLKRRAGVKDSGRLLPGHGGLLDRVDSVLFVALPVAILVYFGPSWLHSFHVGGQNAPTSQDIRLN